MSAWLPREDSCAKTENIAHIERYYLHGTLPELSLSFHQAFSNTASNNVALSWNPFVLRRLLVEVSIRTQSPRESNFRRTETASCFWVKQLRVQEPKKKSRSDSGVDVCCLNQLRAGFYNVLRSRVPPAITWIANICWKEMQSGVKIEEARFPMGSKP